MITRRTFLKASAASGVVLAAPGLSAPAIASGAKITLGYVSPQTGPLAGFAESDAYNIKAFLASEAGKNFQVLVKDSQSNPNRAAEVAKELIVDGKIDMMVVGSTPETTNRSRRPARRKACRSSPPWRPGSPGSSASRAIPATRPRGSRSSSPTIISGSRRHHRDLHVDVEAAFDQRQGRRPLPERCRR